MQVAVIEYARNVSKLDEANSVEFNENTKYKIIDIMADQINIKNK
jgi:CTP synthase